MERIVFLVNFIISLAIFLYVSLNVYKHFRDERVKKVIWYFLLIGFLYLIISIFSFLWFFEILTYVESDFLFIYSLLILLQSLFLFILVYYITNNKRFFYILISYILLFFLVLLLGISFMNYFILASFLFMLFLFIGMVMINEDFRKTGYFGIVYSVVSIICHVLFFLDVGCLCYFNLVSNLFMAVFIWFFLKNLEKSPLSLDKIDVGGKKSYTLVFLSHFVFMLVLINFVFVGTVVLHEFVHLTVSSFYGCEYGKIVYEGNFPRTEILCSGGAPANPLIIASGLLFPSVLAFVLLFIGGKFLREIGLLMLGFNLVVSYRDFSDLGLSDNLIMFFLILGIFLSVAGIMFLARSKTEEYIYSI